jgi:hypothetical protein
MKLQQSGILSIVTAIGIWVLVLQNAGVIPTIATAHAQQRVVDVNIVSSDVTLDTNIAGSDVTLNTNIESSEAVIDANLHSVVGTELVQSSLGMEIGVTSAKNTIIPVHWGEISVRK